jgi:hypothetical protein
MKDLGRCKTIQFFIDLTNETPIYRRMHRLSKHEWEVVDERCKKLHEASLIHSSSSDFITVTIMLTKKDSARLWTQKKMCEDYKPLYLVTPQDRYPMPIPKELFDSIGDSNMFRYPRSFDTLELSIFIAFLLLITIGEVCMLKSKMSLLGVNDVIE